MTTNTQPLPNGTPVQFNNWCGVVVCSKVLAKSFLYTVELDTTKKEKLPIGYVFKAFDYRNFVAGGSPQTIRFDFYLDEIFVLQPEKKTKKKRIKRQKVTELLDLRTFETRQVVLAKPKVIKTEVFQLKPPVKRYYRRRFVLNQKRLKIIETNFNFVFNFN